MAIVVVNEVEGGNQDFYEQVSGKVMSGGKLPEGCQVHIAGPTENGFRIITVWDSEDQFNQFRNEKLIPAVREVGGDDAVAPNITTNPAYRVVTA
jgi:heme-degrading monooxygenase HmoA